MGFTGRIHKHSQNRSLIELEEWLHAQLLKISGKSQLAKAIRYALGRMPKARPYLSNGSLELDNNTAERAVKPVAIGRKNWMFAGSQATSAQRQGLKLRRLSGCSTRA